MAEYLYRELSYKIIGLAMKVHRAFSSGLPEHVYRRSLCHELRTEKVAYETEKKIQVWYDQEMVGSFRADLIVDGLILLELKAVEQLIDQHRSQTLAYLKICNLRLGLLINFGAKSLEVERFII